MLRALDSYDWEQAFRFGGTNVSAALGSEVHASAFDRNDVTLILASREGQNDGLDWLMVGLLHDQRWFFLSAGCDYTGWDCQAGGNSVVAARLGDLFRYGLGMDDRAALGLPQPEDTGELVLLVLDRAGRS